MKSLRSTHASYLAAFILGALIALLLNWPARGANLDSRETVDVAASVSVGQI